MRQLSEEVVAKRKKDFLKKLKEVHGNSIKLVSEYRTVNGELTVKCKTHGEFVTTAKRLTSRGQGCPTCAIVTRSENSTRTRRKQEFDKATQAAKRNGWTVVTTEQKYLLKGRMVEFKCSCGYSWEQTPKVACKAKRCRVCANVEVNKTRQVPLEKRLAAIEFIHDGSIIVTQVFKDEKLRDRAWFECRTCATVWKGYLSRVASGTSCPTCANRRAIKSPRRLQYQIELLGETHYVLGYEAYAIRAILENTKVKEEDICLDPVVFSYKDKGKIRKYIPDFQIGNKIVEVKSVATAGLIPNAKFKSFSNLKKKARAVQRAGFVFILMLMDKDKRIPVPKDWLDYSRKELSDLIYSSSGR